MVFLVSSSFPRRREPSVFHTFINDAGAPPKPTGMTNPFPIAARPSAGRSWTDSSLDLLDLFPVGLRITHRLERHRLHDRVLEALLVDRMDVQPLLLELVGELRFALLDVGGSIRG